MKDNLNTAIHVIRRGNVGARVVGVYRRESKPAKGSYFKYGERESWRLAANDADRYTCIIVQHQATQCPFRQNYKAIVEQLSFAMEKERPIWNELAAFNASA